MFPEGWEQNALIAVLDRIIDYRGQSVPKAKTGIPLITARNVRKGYLDFSTAEFIDENHFDSWMTRGKPRKGDILFTTEAPLGNACRFPENGTYAVGQRTVTLRCSDNLDSEFLLYSLLSEKGQQSIDIRSSGSTAKGFKSSELKKVKFIYPKSLPEQQKIAKILQTWDRAIATTEKLIDASKQQKKALMQQLLTGKKRFAGFEGEWLSGDVGDLIASLEAGVSVNSQDSYQENATQKILKTSCVSNEFFDAGEIKYVVESNEISRLKVPLVGDSILISRMNTPALVGANAYVKDSDANTFLPDRLWLARPEDNIVDMRWLGFWFSSETTRAKLTGLATGTSGSMKNISKQSVVRLKIKVPTPNEQRKIASCLAAADNELQKLKEKLVSLKQEKKALMQQLLTGKRRVKIDD